MKNFFSVLFALILLLAFSACKSTKTIQQAMVKKDTVAVPEVPVEKLPTHMMYTLPNRRFYVIIQLGFSQDSVFPDRPYREYKVLCT